MPWYKVTLTDEDITARRHMTLQDEFGALFMTNRGPKDAAMFGNLDSAEGHHFYFSPGAVRFSMSVLSRWDGRECPVPRSADLALLVT